MSERSKTRGVYQFAVVTCCTTVLLMMAGALVTSNKAADSVPDWPLAYGRLIPPMIGGIRFEYTHRVLAGIVSVLVLLLAIFVAAKESRPLAKKLGWIALVLVFCQAVLGGIRVVEGHPAISATAHAILAQIFFSTLVGLALYLSPWWQREHTLLEDSASPSVTSLALYTTAAIFIQLILGAGFRHGAFGVMPHMTGALVVSALVIWTGRSVRKRFGSVRDLRRWGIFLQAFWGTQILLGVADYWVILKNPNPVQPSLLYVCLSTAHVLVGALMLAASLILTISCYHIIRPGFSAAGDLPARRRATAGGSPERAGV